MANAKHMGVAAAAMGSTWTCGIGGMQGGMRRERVLVVLVGVANMNVAGSQCPVAAGSRGESTRAWWMKVGS